MVKGYENLKSLCCDGQGSAFLCALWPISLKHFPAVPCVLRDCFPSPSPFPAPIASDLGAVYREGDTDEQPLGQIEDWLWTAPSWRSRAALGWLQSRCDTIHRVCARIWGLLGAASHPQEHPHLPRWICSGWLTSLSPFSVNHPSVSGFCTRRVWGCFEAAKALLKCRQGLSMLLSSGTG